MKAILSLLAAAAVVNAGVLPINPRQESDDSPHCTRLDDVHPEMTCHNFVNMYPSDGLAVEDIIQWNPSIGSNCFLRWGEQVCTLMSNHVPRPAPPPIEEPRHWFDHFVQPGQIETCNSWYFVAFGAGESCWSIQQANNVTLSELVEWNPAIGSQCTNLWEETYICVGVEGRNPPGEYPELPEQTTVSSPPDFQPYGQPEDCNEWYVIPWSGGAWYNCGMIAIGTNITRADLQKWNPSLGRNCEGLQAGYGYCVGTASGN